MKLTKEDYRFIKLSFLIFPNKKIKKNNQITGQGYFSRYLISTGLYQLSFWFIAIFIMGESQNFSLFLKFIIIQIFSGMLMHLFLKENVEKLPYDKYENNSRLKNELMLTEQALKNKNIEMEQEQ